jgi:hypothetical protein
VLGAEKLTGDVPVPVLEPGNVKTKTGRLWTYVRDDRPAGSEAAPAVWFAYSPDRKGEHPAQHLQQYAGILQADGYAGSNKLYETGRIVDPAFAESRESVQLQSQYHDGTIKRCQLAQTSRHTFTLAQRFDRGTGHCAQGVLGLAAGRRDTVRLLNLIEGTYDPTGNSTTGRYTVRFQSSWSQNTGLARTDIPQLQLIEVA